MVLNQEFVILNLEPSFAAFAKSFASISSGAESFVNAYIEETVANEIEATYKFEQIAGNVTSIAFQLNRLQ